MTTIKKSSTIVIRPPDDAKRVQAVRKLQIVDTGNEESFDCLTRLAMRVFKVPISIVTFVETDRTYFKSCIGLPGATQAPRDITFCNYTILSKEDVLVVPDATKDERFSNNPFVTDPPGIRFYAGAPLISKDGFPLGSMCIIDTVPRDPLTEEEIVELKRLAKMVVWLTESRNERIQLEQYKEMNSFGLGVIKEDRTKLMKVINMFNQGFIIWDKNKRVKLTNDAFTNITGYSKQEALNFVGEDIFKSVETENESNQLALAFNQMEKSQFTMNSYKKNGQKYPVQVSLQPLYDADGKFDGYQALLTELQTVASSESDKPKVQVEDQIENNQNEQPTTTTGKRPLTEEPFTPNKKINGESSHA